MVNIECQRPSSITINRSVRLADRDRTKPSPIFTLPMTVIAEAVQSLHDWTNWRRIIRNRNGRNIRDGISAVWSDAVIAYHWLGGMEHSRMSFRDCCEHLGWDVAESRERIFSQFKASKLIALNCQYAVEWLRNEYIVREVKPCDCLEFSGNKRFRETCRKCNPVNRSRAELADLALKHQAKINEGSWI